MTNEEIENEILFEEIRTLTPQWKVSFKNKEIGIVTERVISKPTYVLRINELEVFFENREEIMEHLCVMIKTEKNLK